jgi:tetratricopeptide (TPR) repeat protein
LDVAGFETPWKELIEKFPESPWRPAALYYMGYTQTLRGETVTGLRYFEELAAKFPQAMYTQQALIFIGEYYFNENKLEKAAEAYDKVLDFADSKYFEQALYKLGDSRLGAKLLHRMAVIYTQAGRMDRSKRALEALMSGYPDYEKMPEAIMELGRAYEKEQNYLKAAEVREKAFRQYCRNGDWYKKAPPSARANADSISEAAIEMVARHYLYEAKQLASATGEGARVRDTYLRKAVSAYESFLSIYPENKNRAKYNYQQAEAYYSLEDFGAAARKYMLVSKLGDPKLKKAAAYNAIVAAQEMLKKSEDAKK